MFVPKRIVFHCSDSDIKAHDNIETIRKWHKARGFRDVGYHYFINKQGILQSGRSVYEQGAHVKNQNHDTLAICISGRHAFEPIQFSTGAFIAKSLCAVFNIDPSEVFPHNAVDDDDEKTCPNFNIKEITKRMS